MTIGAAVFNALQTDARWTEDATGYNFRDTIGGAKFPDGNHVYRVEYKFTGAGGELFAIVFELPAQDLLGE